MSNIFTLDFSRLEMTWLYRQLMGGKDKADAHIKQFSGDVISLHKASEEQLATLKEAQESIDSLTINGPSRP